MWGIDPKVQRSFDAAQRAYERQQPPGFDDPAYADDCEDGECGECQQCVYDAKEYAAELAAEAKWEAQRDRRMGL